MQNAWPVSRVRCFGQQISVFGRSEYPRASKWCMRTVGGPLRVEHLMQLECPVCSKDKVIDGL
jgi:hypothetical protein